MRQVLSTATSIDRAAAAIAIVAIPLVWAVGYQDHPWRQHAMAIALGGLLLATSIWLAFRGWPTERASSRLVVAASILSAATATVLAIVWWLFNVTGDI